MAFHRLHILQSISVQSMASNFLIKIKRLRGGRQKSSIVYDNGGLSSLSLI